MPIFESGHLLPEAARPRYCAYIQRCLASGGRIIWTKMDEFLNRDEVTQPRVTCYRIGIRMNEPQMAALLVAHHRPGFISRPRGRRGRSRRRDREGLGRSRRFDRVTLPAPVLSSVDLIAKAAGGTSLFALELMLYGEPVKINADVLVNLGLKNLLMPLLMALGAVLFGVTGAAREQVISSDRRSRPRELPAAVPH